MRRTPDYEGLRPASERASVAARAASRKSGSGCEITLRRELWRLGLRYRIAPRGIAGRPDVVFAAARVAVFCDGDFWHGRDLEHRLARLAAGHNAPYWVAKIRTNCERDQRRTLELEALCWRVLRFWESDIQRNASQIAETIRSEVEGRLIDL